MKTKRKKRFMAILLVLVMVFTTGTMTYAAETEEDEVSAEDIVLETDDDPIELLDATQVIEGSGSIGIYRQGSDSETPEYILKATDVPTNTEINLDSPHLTLTDQSGKEVTGITLVGNVVYVANDGEEIQVSYMMLDDDAADEGEYVLTPYGADNEALDMSSVVNEHT